MLNELAKHQVTELDIALGQLTLGAAFFAVVLANTQLSPKEKRDHKLLCL
jgi:hypothetical protein